MRLCVLVTWTFGENSSSLLLGGLSSCSSRHSSSAKDTKLLYQCTLLGLWGFEGSCTRFKSLLKLKLRLIGCRLRFITAGNSAALPLISDPIFRRNDFRSNLPLALAAFSSPCASSLLPRIDRSSLGSSETTSYFFKLLSGKHRLIRY